MVEEKSTQGGILVAGGVGGALVGFLAGLALPRPVAGATPDTKLDYLIALTEAIGTLLAQVHQDHQSEITLLQNILLALGGTPSEPGGEVTVLTPWRGKEPVQLFNQEIRAVVILDTDQMLSWVEGKRLLLKAESSLDQVVTLQPMGNITNTMVQATNIGPPVPCPINGNASIGFAWDDWQPYIGVRITVPVAPTVGLLTIWGVIQE